jgi:serine/tyrosine/threonine adenylyltransferase
MAKYRPEHVHASLGAAFYDIVAPAKFPKTILRHRNQRWAANVGLHGLAEADWLAHFGHFEPLQGSLPQPLALRYHGHQFRHYNPDLGDGRGFLFAQLRDGAGRLLDLGTKGSGTTPWSRRGDGRLTLKGGVREVLASAMLEALGVNTSKTFSLIETGEELMRGDEPSPTRSAVLVRLSHSHIRIGSFQRLLAHQDAEGMARLMAHCVAHYLPEAARATMVETAAAFLEAVMASTAGTTAGWMAAGFVHGVLNTDNINITGESFDYGPWRFLPQYEPGFTAAYFDETGLYAYGRQPEAISWNLARLAECLMLLAPRDVLEPVLAKFDDMFWVSLRAAILARLGLVSAGAEADDMLVKVLFSFLYATKAPFEQVMFDLYLGEMRLTKALNGPSVAHYAHASFEALKAALAVRDVVPSAQLSHAYFQRETPVTLLYPDIEQLWEAIAERDDWSLFEAKLDEIEMVRLAYGFGLG